MVVTAGTFKSSPSNGGVRGVPTKAAAREVLDDKQQHQDDDHNPNDVNSAWRAGGRFLPDSTSLSSRVSRQVLLFDPE
jgi:hypothetical protein